MTSFYLRKSFEDQTPEEDVFDLLENFEASQTGFDKVVDWAVSRINSTDEVDVARWIANEMLETDAVDTCYAGFSSWLADAKYSRNQTY